MIGADSRRLIMNVREKVFLACSRGERSSYHEILPLDVSANRCPLSCGGGLAPLFPPEAKPCAARLLLLL